METGIPQSVDKMAHCNGSGSLVYPKVLEPKIRRFPSSTGSSTQRQKVEKLYTIACYSIFNSGLLILNFPIFVN
jgi:hypothetical protein